MKYFFSGLGGAGTLPLAFILKGMGHSLAWSDRGRDLAQNPAKFSALEAIWPEVYPQDGSGPRAVAGEAVALVPSGSVEPNVPDIAAAREVNLPIVKRPELLAQLFNAAKVGVSIAGTSGKTTTTGMTGYLLKTLGADPTVMNGGIFRNYAQESAYCCALVGQSGVFVTEADESDGSIALYRPRVAVLTNISLDHKSMEELRALFAAYIASAPMAVLNADDAEVAALRPAYQGSALTYGFTDGADLRATDVVLRPDGSTCHVHHQLSGQDAVLNLAVLGKHNISNALAALGVALLLGHPLKEAAAALAGFSGIQRRLEVIGQASGVTVIDDFAHNPDKISASLAALKAFPGRLLVLFQPHGYGPLRLMRHEFAASFARYLDAQDLLFLPQPLYLGGTVNREVTSDHLGEDLRAHGLKVQVGADRNALTANLLATARKGDRIVVMGARDDSLADYARALLASLATTA